jgi:hypothetical protein
VLSILIVVVLPAPLGPSRPNSSPRRTVKLTPRTATTSTRFGCNHPVRLRYVRTSPSASIAVSSMPGTVRAGRRGGNEFGQRRIDGYEDIGAASGSAPISVTRASPAGSRA